MKRSPAPIRSAPLSRNSTASHSPSWRSTRRCMRSVSGSRGRWTPGRSTSTSCQRSPSSSPFAIPRIARRVVCGLLEVTATFAPTIAFTSVDLPTFGPPGDGDETGARHGPRAPSASTVVAEARASRRRRSRGRARRGEERRERPPPRGPARVLGADHDVAELARAGAGPDSSTGKDEHVGRLVAAAKARGSAPDSLSVDELDADVAVLDARRRAPPRRRRRSSRRAVDLAARSGAACADARAERRSGAWLCPCSA